MDLSKYPLLEARQETPFVEQLVKAYTVGGRDYVMSVNGTPMARAIWNLLITQRDLNLWCGKHKMKPHRHWKVTQVKTYFGIKGNGQALLKRFEALKEEAQSLIEEYTKQHRNQTQED